MRGPPCCDWTTCARTTSRTGRWYTQSGWRHSVTSHPGEFVAIVGRSGCGKSTLLNLAGAMDFPTSGTVWIDGVNTSTLAESGLTKLRREKVGFIFQSFQLLHTLSVSKTWSCRCCSRASATPANGARST